MGGDKYIQDCKIFLATDMIRSENVEESMKKYGQTIVSIGYVGFVTLWAQLWGRIDAQWLLISGGLILVSGSLFVGLEVAMIRFNRNGIINRKVLYRELALAIQEEDRKKICSKIGELKPEGYKDGYTIVALLADISIWTGFVSALVLIAGIVCFFANIKLF
jgi:hypothetical protein